jgi:tRNA (guanine-N7-)-methyltransferase
MRKKPHLRERLETCAAFQIREPETVRGNWRASFPGYQALDVELGCGKGSFTAETARQHPERFLLAVEIVSEALVMAMEKAKDGKLANVRFLQRDAAQLPELFDAGEVDRIYVNFCDPWPKSHDAKHRLTAPIFLRKYATALQQGGEVHFKTDNAPLFAWSLEEFRKEGWQIRLETDDLHAGGPSDIMTDYEKKFYAKGVPIHKLIAVRTEETKSTADGPAPRLYQAGIARPYKTAELFAAGETGESKK